jgi:glycosyltransferase involved in cell wall biosynthesis
MFYYLPIEPYEERYTCYLSTPNGFWESFLRKNDIPYKALRGEARSENRIRIGAGQVLDTYTRSVWCMSQIAEFLRDLDGGLVKDGDVVYIEDFWHPGFEALPYARAMSGIDFRIYAWCHADTWDQTDFTYYRGMEPWKRYFELGIAKSLNGMFVADAGLKELIMQAGGDLCPIHAVGTCWNTDWIRKRYGYNPNDRRENIVVFASRWDEDKDPMFFCKLVLAVAEDLSAPKNVKFMVTTGFRRLTSNRAEFVDMAKTLKAKLPHMFEIYEDLSKASYMALLNTAKVHFNCAHHDWVSYALLESCAMGCMPLFPDYRSFPLALDFNLAHLYDKGNLESAKKKLYSLLNRNFQPYMEEIFTRFDNAIPYVAHTMGIY